MPAIARTKYFKSDIVKNPPKLPILMYSGDVDWSLSFEGFPTGSLEYTNIAEDDLPAFEKAYNYRKGGITRKIYLKIYGIDFQISSYGYDRKSALWRDRILINVYSVSIGLKSRWEELVTQDVKVFKLIPISSSSFNLSTLCSYLKIPYSGLSIDVAIPSGSDKNYSVTIDSIAKDYARIKGCYVSYVDGVTLKSLSKGGGLWMLNRQEVVTDGKNTLADSVGYRETELTWNPDNNKDEVSYSKKEPVIQVLEEIDEDLESPPKGTIVLKSMVDCHDNSGPKKTKHKTTSVNGSTDTEETWIWSFEYTAEEVCLENTLPFTDKPEDFWKLIEYQKTTHKYERIDGLALNIRAKDPDPKYANTDLSGFVYLVVHPDYENFVNYSGQSGVFYSSAKYLTESKTEGWRSLRFEQESDDKLITLDNEDPFYPLCQFRKIPSESISANSLINSRTLYNTEPNLPFTVEWKLYTELEERIKQKIDTSSQQISTAGKVGILYPDPNFVEPMAITVESHKTSSFAFTPHPESTPDQPVAPKITGEETFNKTERTIVDPNKYKEKVSEYSTQNSGFSDLIEKVVFKDVSGKLPEATTRKSDWEKKDGSLSQPLTKTTLNRYFLTSDDSQLLIIGGTKSYSLAKTLEEALKAAKTELQLEGMQKDACSRSVFSFYPNMRDGDRVVTELDRFSKLGDWRITNATFKLTFRGVSTKYGLVPICQAAPISVSLGLVRNRSIQVEIKDAASVSDSTNSLDPKMSVTGGTTTKLGEVLINSPNRRRF